MLFRSENWIGCGNRQREKNISILMSSGSCGWQKKKKFQEACYEEILSTFQEYWEADEKAMVEGCQPALEGCGRC